VYEFFIEKSSIDFVCIFSEKGSYTVSFLRPETCPVHRTHFTVTSLIYVVPCISIYCNLQTEIYSVEEFFLKCNFTRHEISLSWKTTFSHVFVTRRIDIDSIKVAPLACKMRSEIYVKLWQIGSAR
jgi:hypothetical protein